MLWSDYPIKRGVSPRSVCSLYTSDGIVAFEGDHKKCAGCHFFVPGDNNTGDGDCHNTAISGFHMAQAGIKKMSHLCYRCSHGEGGCSLARSGVKVALNYLTDHSTPKMCSMFDERIKPGRETRSIQDIDSALFG